MSKLTKKNMDIQSTAGIIDENEILIARIKDHDQGSIRIKANVRVW